MVLASSLHDPPIPQRADEGPLTWYPRAQWKEQIFPYGWVGKRQSEGETTTSSRSEGFLHLVPF